MSDNVIDFKVGTLQVKPKTFEQKHCSHVQVLVDESTQMIECCSCGVILTPFEYVMRWATKETRYINNIKYLKVEQQQLESEIKDLKRQKTNLKSQVRRSKKLSL